MLILGIESSCDETAAALVSDGNIVLSSSVSSQVDIHHPFGGVVPELASRKHIESIVPVVEDALEKAGKTPDQIDAIAVTQGPGLIGSLLFLLPRDMPIPLESHGWESIIWRAMSIPYFSRLPPLPSLLLPSLHQADTPASIM